MATLDRVQQRILLVFGKPMDLINEQKSWALIG
jgi:hypothetical protein